MVSVVEEKNLGNRVDAEYYKPYNLDLFEKLRKVSPVPIETFADVTDGIHASPQWVEEDGVTYLSAKSVKDNRVVLETAGQISKEQDAANPRTQARLNDVIVSSVGTIGNAAVVEDYVLPANMDRHLGIIRIRDESVDPYYLSAFLNSEFGRFQTLRESTGNVQLNLFIEKIKSILVPVGEQYNAIGEFIRSASEKRKESQNLYQQAETMLLEALELHTLDLSPQLTYTATSEEVFKDNRFDAEHFQPKYYNTLEALENLNPKAMMPLGKLLTTLTNGHTPTRHNLSEGDIVFLTAEHVHDFKLSLDADKRILKEHHKTILNRTQLENDDILVTIKGRVGNVAVVEGLGKPTNINQDVALLKLKPGYHPYYIAGLLNSQAGKMLTEHASTGQINPFLSLTNLRTILIPVFDTERMNELGDAVAMKVYQARNAENEAKDLLETAKARVEALILGGDVSP